MTTPQQAGMVDLGDTSFQPEASSYSGDGVRFFRMSQSWPNKPLEGRKFQLGGKERVALLEEGAYMCWAHRFSKEYMGSGVNGVRRCTLETLGHCVACDHYEAAPEVMEGDKKVKKARCGPRRQQFALNVLAYKSDLEGKLLDEQNRVILITPDRGPVYEDGHPAKLLYEVFLWRFSADKYTQLRDIKVEWQTLLKQDLLFTLAPGKPENFQDFSPTVLPNSAWRSVALRDKDEAREIAAYYQENRYDTAAIMGKEYSDDDMMQFLGLKSSNGATAPVAAQATEDVAKEIEQAIAQAGQPTAEQAPDVPPTTPPPSTPSAPPQAAEPAPPTAQPPAPQAPPPPAVPGGDFDDLLK